MIYPLGEMDDDPEEVIRFRGLTAFPPAKDLLLPPKARKNGHRNKRARVIIAFFGLNKRSDLLWERARKIRELDKCFALINNGDPEQVSCAKADIELMTNELSEHAACVRGMIRLYERDFKRAQLFFAVTRAFLKSKTPKKYVELNGRVEPAAP